MSSYQDGEEPYLQPPPRRPSSSSSSIPFPMTPREVIEQMSFAPAFFNSFLTPNAPPPAAPPPPIPASGSREDSLDAYGNIPTITQYQQNDNDDDGNNHSSSYQHPSNSSYQGYHHDPLSSSSDQPYVSPYQRYDRIPGGDTNINPNTGQTNDGVGGVGSLSELLVSLRWLTLCVGSVTLILEFLALTGRILVTIWTAPAKVVLSFYLDVACLLVVGIDVVHPVLMDSVTVATTEEEEEDETTNNQNGGTPRRSRRQSLSDFLRDKVGFLYRPLGRAMTLLWMAGMVLAIDLSWWEVVISLGFFVCGIGYIYCYLRFPEYRAWDTYHHPTVDGGRPVWDRTASANSWSDPYAFRPADVSVASVERVGQRNGSVVVPEFIRNVVVRNLIGGGANEEHESLLGSR